MGGHVETVGPQVALVDQDHPAALQDEAGGPGLGHPGAVDVTGAEGIQRVGVRLGADRDVAAPGRVGGQALGDEPGAQRHVLGVAQLRCGDGGAGQILRSGDPGADDQEGAAGGGAGDDADGLAVGLGVAVDRGVGADEGHVEALGEHRLDHVGPGVEVLDLQVDVLAQGVGEEALGVPDDGGSVGHVGEVAQANGGCAAAVRRLRKQ